MTGRGGCPGKGPHDGKSGADIRGRTGDLALTTGALYHLSYVGTNRVGMPGIEPGQGLHTWYLHSP